eukprot:9144167-Alexandrium_andersonii.AAC.1
MGDRRVAFRTEADNGGIGARGIAELIDNAVAAQNIRAMPPSERPSLVVVHMLNDVCYDHRQTQRGVRHCAPPRWDSDLLRLANAASVFP